MAGLTIGDVERVFRQRGWRYESAGGRMRTTFDGVPMLVTVDPNGQMIVLVVPIYLPDPAERQASRAHEQDVDTFLSAVNYGDASGAFVRNVEEGDIYYMTGVMAPHALISADELDVAIGTAVAAAQAVGPVVAAIVHGRLKLEEALEILRRAMAQLRRRIA